MLRHNNKLNQSVMLRHNNKLNRHFFVISFKSLMMPPLATIQYPRGVQEFACTPQAKAALYYIITDLKKLSTRYNRIRKNQGFCTPNP